MQKKKSVLPAGQPRGKRSPSWASKHSTPVVETTGSRVRGADLSHWQPHTHSEASSHEPSVDKSDCPAESQAGVIGGGDPGEDRDDGEGDGEVGEDPENSKCFNLLEIKNWNSDGDKT